MRDYLEELMEAGVEALWEADRRLTAALSVMGTVRKPSRPGDPEADSGKEGVAAGPTWPEGPAALFMTMEDVLEEGKNPLPLMEQAAALERAVQSAAQQEGMNPGRQPVADSMPGGGRRTASGNGPWAELPSPAGVRTAFEREGIHVEDTDRAERLDRIFRRDSRRYDGGFFLY